MKTVNKLLVGAAGFAINAGVLFGAAEAASATPPPVQYEFVTQDSAGLQDGQIVSVEMNPPSEEDGRAFYAVIGSLGAVAFIGAGALMRAEHSIAKARQS